MKLHKALGKLSTAFALSCLGMLGISSAVAAENEAPPSTDVKLESTTGCQYFLSKQCEGSRQTVSVEFKNANGNKLLMGYTKFGEGDDYTFLDKSLRLGHIGSLNATADRDMALHGSYGFIGKEWRLNPKAGFKVEGYAGRISAEINAHAELNVKTNAFTVNVPAVHVPAVPRLGTPAYDFAGVTIDVPAFERTLSQYNRDFAVSSAYGGLRQASGLGMQTSPKSMVFVGQMANVGFDMINYGVNAGVIVASSALNDAEAPLGDVCNGRLQVPADGFSLTANVCVMKYARHPLYDAERKKAGQWADKVNARLSDAAQYVHGKTGYTATVPTYTADNVLEVLGADNPYAHAHTRLQFAASVKKGNLSGAIGVQIPVGSDAKYGTTTSVMANYRF